MYKSKGGLIDMTKVCLKREISSRQLPYSYKTQCKITRERKCGIKIKAGYTGSIPNLGMEVGCEWNKKEDC